jgi:hypothetical protein
MDRVWMTARSIAMRRTVGRPMVFGRAGDGVVKMPCVWSSRNGVTVAWAT